MCWCTRSIWKIQLELSQQVVVLGARHSPSNTLISPPRWLSECTGIFNWDAEKILDTFVGILLLRLIRTVMIPSAISIPRKTGATSMRRFLVFSRLNTGTNCHQDGSTRGDVLVSVDAHFGLLAVKEVGNEIDYTGDTGGTTDQDDFMDVRLLPGWITESRRTISTGCEVAEKRSWHSSLKRARA